MIFEEHQIKFIVTGRTTKAVLPPRPDGRRPCTPGRSYILQKRTARLEDDNGQLIRPATVRSTGHRLVVTHVEPDDTGNWAVTFHLDNRAPLTLLHRRSEKGYTTRPADAMRGEPEAIDQTTLNKYARESQQDHAARIVNYERRIQSQPLADRVRELEEAHARGDVDLSRLLAGIRRRVEAADKKRHHKAA